MNDSRAKNGKKPLNYVSVIHTPLCPKGCRVNFVKCLDKNGGFIYVAECQHTIYCCAPQPQFADEKYVRQLVESL